MSLRLTAGAILGFAAGAVAWLIVAPATMVPLVARVSAGTPAPAFRTYFFVWGSFAVLGAVVGTTAAYLTRRRADP